MKTLLFSLMVSGAAVAAASSAGVAAAASNTQAAQTAQASDSSNAGAVTAQSLRGKTVYGSDSKNLGVVNDVVRDKDNKVFLVVKDNGGQSVLVPADQLSENANKLDLKSGQNDLKSFPIYKGDDTAYHKVGDQDQVALKSEGQQSGGAAHIVVQQQAPGVEIHQSAPKVQITQAEPSISVQQPQPEITVHQPAPTVTRNIPKPEITVRMPRPEVHVAQAQPQVQVQQPQPKVQVVQPPQQAQVSVNDNQAKPQVNVSEQGQPKVNYDQAQPKVTVNQENGPPKVHYQQADQASAGDDANAQKGTTHSAARTPQEQQAYLKEFGDAQGSSSGSNAGAGATKEIQVSQLDKMAVYNARGDKLGTVDRTIEDKSDNKQYVVVAHGGFLGFGQDEVAFPIERFALKGGDHLVIHGATTKDIENMDNWRNQVANHQDVPGNEKVEVSTLK